MAALARADTRRHRNGLGGGELGEAGARSTRRYNPELRVTVRVTISVSVDVGVSVDVSVDVSVSVSV